MEKKNKQLKIMHFNLWLGSNYTSGLLLQVKAGVDKFPFVKYLPKTI